MPKRALELTAQQVKTLNKPGQHSVGGIAGLKMQISDSGAKSWVLRTVMGVRRREIGLGAYPEVSMAMARELAREIKQKIKQGIDPVAERQAIRQKLISEQVRQVTFRQVAEQFIEKKTQEFKETSRAKQRQRLANSLENYAFPLIGSLPVGNIEREHILQVLEPIWESKSPTAERLRNNLERILDLAEVKGLRTGMNPARWKGNLSHILPMPSKVSKVEHMEALPVEDVPAFMEKLRKLNTTSALALRFAVLTCARSSEIRWAVWSEMDVDKRLWTIPVERMKAGKKHTIPLCDEAVELLKQFKPDRAEGLVFLNINKRLSENAMLAVLKKTMKLDITQHGFRSTFKDWARTHTRYPDEASELALAHVHDDKTRAAYARDELLDTRRKMMTDWGEYCLHGKKETGKVIELKA